MRRRVGRLKLVLEHSVDVARESTANAAADIDQSRGGGGSCGGRAEIFLHLLSLRRMLLLLKMRMLSVMRMQGFVGRGGNVVDDDVDMRRRWT